MTLACNHLAFKKEDFLTEGLISQISYRPLRMDILNLIDGVTFNEALLDMKTIQLENDMVINYIGLNENKGLRSPTGQYGSQNVTETA
jgi:hypothetical protein